MTRARDEAQGTPFPGGAGPADESGSDRHVEGANPVVDAGTLRRWLAEGRPVVVVDVRGDGGPGIPGSIHFNAMAALKAGDATAMDALDVPPGACVVTACNLGHAAGVAAKLLRERGIEARSLEGGFKAWDEAGRGLSGPADAGEGASRASGPASDRGRDGRRAGR